jgi:hypothetical protein
LATGRALDASSVPTDAHGKKQHVVEILNIIDKGTSILVAHHVRSDFNAQTALAAVAQTFAEHGLPTSITLDRDTRLRWERLKAVIFPPPLYAFVMLWESPCSFAIRITLNKTALSNAITAPSIRSA